MTKFKIYRINHSGYVTVEIVNAYDWANLIQRVLFAGDPIFKMEAYGSKDEFDNTDT